MRLDLFIKNNLASFLNNSSLAKEERENLFELPRSFWQKEINLGNIKIEDKIVKPSINITEPKKSLVNIDWGKIKKNWKLFYKKKLVPTPVKITTLVVGPEILAINKPAGISVHPSFPLKRSSKREPSLIEGVIYEFPEVAEVSEIDEEERPGIVHRLDKNTSGILLIARDIKTKRFLKKQFKKRLIEKTYFALVEGDFPYTKFKISSLIGKKASVPMKMSINNLKINGLHIEIARKFSPHNKQFRILNPKESLTCGVKIASGTLGKIAVAETRRSRAAGYLQKKIFLQWKRTIDTSIEVNKESRFSLLELHPITGRTHQIRVHLSSLGFPIVGDKIYGNCPKNIFPLHCLHSYKISWRNRSGERLSATSDRIILF